MLLYLHSITPHSSVNGPGRRTVLHTQGCSLGCKGCFNPLTHTFEGGTPWTVDALVKQVQQLGDEGITWSGGEPTEQLEAVLAISQRLKQLGFSQVMFSGRTKGEIETLSGGAELLQHLDVLIDGRYQAELGLRRGLRGSANQKVHLLSDRYPPEALEPLDKPSSVELLIAPDGSVMMSGFPTPQLANSVRKALGQA